MLVFVMFISLIKKGMHMSSSEKAFRESFTKLLEARNKQLTNEDESDNIIELGDATE